jgi:hypothetical protein
MFTVLKLDDFVPKDHPLRPIRTWLNDALKRMDDVFARMIRVFGGIISGSPEEIAQQDPSKARECERVACQLRLPRHNRRLSS